MAKQKKENTFEANIVRIEEILELLNNTELPLEEAIKLHQEASEKILLCEKYLEKTTLEFETLK